MKARNEFTNTSRTIAAWPASAMRNTPSCRPTSAFSVIDCSISWRAWYLPATALVLTKDWMKPLQADWAASRNSACCSNQGNLRARQASSELEYAATAQSMPQASPRP